MDDNRLTELKAPPTLAYYLAVGFTEEIVTTGTTWLLHRTWRAVDKRVVYEWTPMAETDTRFQSASKVQGYFTCRRQLLRLVQGYDRGRPKLFGYFLEDHVYGFGPEYVTITIDPALVADYDGKPVADIVIGRERSGAEKNWDHSWGGSLKLSFASEAQANAYIIASGLGMPRMLQHEGSTFELQTNGSYQDSSGTLLAAAIVLFYLSPSAEARAELVAQHPELASIAPPIDLSAAPDGTTDTGHGASIAADSAVSASADTSL